MTLLSEFAALSHLFPESVIGAVETVQPVTDGLSGAHVYFVSSTRGQWVLRIAPEHAEQNQWSQQLRILRCAAQSGVAPALVHVDDKQRATLSARVEGAPLASALMDPRQRAAALSSVVEQLRVLHQIDVAGISDADPVSYARERYVAQRNRSGFPVWAGGIAAALDELQETIARDPRRVLSHNDMNPGNVLWDGTRAWLVDWEVGGLNHPFYDLATLAMFIQLEDAAAYELLAAQEQHSLSSFHHQLFDALRRVAALLCGLVMLGMVPDLTSQPSAALTLQELYAGLRTGRVDLRSEEGQSAFGMALLRVGLLA